jgi:outer membrane protein TolC
MTRRQSRGFLFSIAVGIILSHPVVNFALDDGEKLNLKQTIEAAIEVNLRLQQSQDEVKAAEANKNASRTEFFPTLNARYFYLRRDQPTTQVLGTDQGAIDVLINPEDEYNFVTSFSQPIFTGFALLNQYKIASLGLDVAEISEKLTRQDIILDAKNAYYSILKAQKLMQVAEITVKQITAQKDLLQSQVQLANAKQSLITAQNNLAVAKAQFNTLLRRPVNAPVSVEDILDYMPFEQDIDYCLTQAGENRLEIQVADLDVEIAEKDYKLTQRDYYPSVNVTGTWTRRGTEWDVDGGEGIGDKNFWSGKS